MERVELVSRDLTSRDVSSELRLLPAELLVLSRLGVGYAHLLAAWRVSQRLDCEPAEVLEKSGIITTQIWADAQAILAKERREAIEVRNRRNHLLDQAINNLHRNLPQYSVRKTITIRQAIRFALYGGILLVGFRLGLEMMGKWLFACLTLFYSAVIVLRSLVLSQIGSVCTRESNIISMDDADLPVYTALVALYKEADQVDDLLRHLYQLDWPKDKLDIKLICESDDLATINAINRHRLPACFELVIVPYSQPRTKPKALNYALPLVQGEFTVLYDAEDRPVPGQLREAHAKFLVADETLACVQAPLRIHNHHQNWLTTMFSIEYLTLFNGILPVLAQWRVPLPLGGTSNHFRTEILKQVGGWDPYNVTEDADLGIRLFREGYYTQTIAAPTFEEAPPKLGVWMKQRTRWIKGWMQTLLVHGREPIVFMLDMGFKNALAYHLVLTSLVISALLHPLLLYFFFSALLNLSGILASEIGGFFLTTSVFNLVGGYTTYGLLALLVMRLHGQTNAHVILTLPVYWLLVSVAAWRAVIHLFLKPHHWEKTPHGLAREDFHITDH